MKRFFFIILLGFSFVGTAYALSIPEKPDGYVNDTTGLLSKETRQRIEQTLEDFERATSNQIVIAIFESLESESLEDYSIRLAERWKIGSKKNNNGIILLIFKNEHKVRIEVGYGLEGALPDAISNQIIRQEITPAFREGRYDQGVTDAVNAIMLATKGEYKGGSALAGRDPIKSAAPYIFIILVAFMLAPLVCYALVMMGSVFFLGFPAGFGAGFFLVLILVFLRRIFGSPFFGETISGRRGGTWGGGGFSGGGFGGGFSAGGGSFGGGGSSGGW